MEMWPTAAPEQRTVAPGPRKTRSRSTVFRTSKPGCSAREYSSDSGVSEPFEDDGRGNALSRKDLGRVIHL